MLIRDRMRWARETKKAWRYSSEPEHSARALSPTLHFLQGHSHSVPFAAIGTAEHLVQNAMPSGPRDSLLPHQGARGA